MTTPGVKWPLQRSVGRHDRLPIARVSVGAVHPELEPHDEAALRLKVLAGHEMVARLSTNSARAIADHSGHFIQIDAPRLVVASVEQVVGAARTHGRVDARALEAFAHQGPYPPRD